MTRSHDAVDVKLNLQQMRGKNHKILYLSTRSFTPIQFVMEKMKTNKYQSPAYFHAKDLGCLVCIEVLKERKLAVTDCYISNATMCTLQKGHISILRRRKLWDGLLKAREDFIDSI